MNLNDSDFRLLEEKGISVARLERQLKDLAEGFPYLRIEAPATVGHGITLPGDELEQKSVDI